ncbi:MAG: glycoside hydrolase family 6 protein [Solirubrobacteraceae bacterium]
MLTAIVLGGLMGAMTSAARAGTTTITFKDLPVGTLLSNQYASPGVVFGGAVPSNLSVPRNFAYCGAGPTILGAAYRGAGADHTLASEGCLKPGAHARDLAPSSSGRSRPSGGRGSARRHNLFPHRRSSTYAVQTTSNPLAGVKWGIYRGPLDSLYPAYALALGSNRQLLAKEALEPSVHWLGSWVGNATAGAAARAIISASGGPRYLSQIAVFRLQPWEGGACHHVTTAADAAGYRAWIDNFAHGVGSARLLVVLQPDLPFALCAPGRGRAALSLVAYASRVLSALPHTSVYIDAGAGDYASASDTAYLLEHAGIRYARGFSLNDTHADAIGRELEFGATLLRRLGAAHITGRHFVVNTAENGQPYTQYYYQHRGRTPPVCSNRSQRLCQTLGIPPGADVSNRRWGLRAHDRSIAAQDCDGYIWVSRPWLTNGAGAFDLQLALQLARSAPF